MSTASGRDAELILGQTVTTLGRGDHLPLPFLGYPGRDLEAEHARITRQTDGQFLLEDNHSRLGTRLNGQPVQAATPLKDGDLIKLGTNIVRFHSRQWGRLRAAAAAIALARRACRRAEAACRRCRRRRSRRGAGHRPPVAPRSAAARWTHASCLAIAAGGLPAGIAVRRRRRRFCRVGRCRRPRRGPGRPLPRIPSPSTTAAGR